MAQRLNYVTLGCHNVKPEKKNFTINDLLTKPQLAYLQYCFNFAAKAITCQKYTTLARARVFSLSLPSKTQLQLCKIFQE